MVGKYRILGALWAVLAMVLAFAPNASAVVVHGAGGQFLGVTPRPGVSPTAIPGSAAAAHPAAVNAAGSSWENLSYQGGPVLHSSDPYVIFWAPNGETIPASSQALIERYFTDAASDSSKATNVYAVGRQYTDSAGFADYQQTFNSGSQVVQDFDSYPTTRASDCSNSPYTTCLTDGQLQTEISSVIAAAGLPSDGPASASELPGGAPIYFVVLPTDVDVCFGDGSGTCASNDFCAYHSAYADGATNVLYAAIPTAALSTPQDAKGCQWDGNGLVQEPNTDVADVALKYISHEDNETITDPLGTGWWNDYTGNEDGDNCNDYYTNANAFLPTLGGDAGAATLYNQLIDGHQYYLQSEWSNGGSDCEMHPASGTITPRFSVPAGPRTAGSALSFDPSASTATYKFTSETWTWGDGTATTFHAGRPLTLATHTYATSGDYPVTLTLVDNHGNLATTTEAISVGAAPTAALTASPTQFEEGSGPVSFDASSSSDTGASIVSYAWDFGDGATAQGAAASHTYATAGTYLVRLTVTDSLGQADTASITVTVSDEPPVAAFSAGAATPEAGQSVPFDGSSSSDGDGSVTSYAWQFGDGHSGTGRNPSHTYTSPGTYTVKLTVTDSAGASADTAQFLTVVDVPPVARFDASPAVPIPGQSITFDGSGSSDADSTIASYGWDFGDGATGSGAKPTHAYASAGAYTVRLTVVGRDGLSDTVSEPVTVYAQPQATFSYSPVLPVAGAAAMFSAASSNSESLGSYVWSFGDGTTATGASAAHTYAREGTYMVTLTATDALGLSSSVSEVVTVINRPPAAVLVVRSGTPMPRHPIRFSGARSHNNNPILSYRWHFGDGTGGVGKNITHTYARAGTYRVSLTVRDSFGGTATRTTTIRVGRTAARRSKRRRR